MNVVLTFMSEFAFRLLCFVPMIRQCQYGAIKPIRNSSNNNNYKHHFLNFQFRTFLHRFYLCYYLLYFKEIVNHSL